MCLFSVLPFFFFFGTALEFQAFLFPTYALKIIKVSLRTALAVPPSFLISNLISTLTLLLFSDVLLNFPAVLDFLVIILLFMISHISTMIRECALNYFNTLKFIKLTL